MKRKHRPTREEDERIKKRKIALQNATKHMEMTKDSIRKTAKLFGLGRESLSKFVQHGYQTVGRPPLLGSGAKETFKLFLSSLDSVQMQQSIKDTSAIVQSISHHDSPPSDTTVRKYILESGLKLRKARPSDKGRVRASESIESFVHFYDVLERCLDDIQHDPKRIFNVDEVGVQCADRSLRLVTSREYLNKALINTTLHVTLVLCTSPGNNGYMMPPHFVFQHPKDSPIRNYLAGTSNATCDSNESGYQDEKTWKTWMSLFVKWKDQWLTAMGYPNTAKVVLLLDGHYSHLDVDVLFTAAMNRVVVVCMLAHATHIVQPNDRTVNRAFKDNLDHLIASFASNNMEVENFDIAHMSEKALEMPNVRKGIVSSFRQVGIYPFDREIVIRVLKKYHISVNEDDERVQLDKIKAYLDEKMDKKERMMEDQAERKRAASAIKFGTQKTTVLTSSTSMGRNLLYSKWKKAKKLLKKPLITLMTTEFGFSEKDIEKKTVAELKKMVEGYLLNREATLIFEFQRTLDAIPISIPSSVHNVLVTSNAAFPTVDCEVASHAQQKIGEECTNVDDHDTLEQEILQFLQESYLP